MAEFQKLDKQSREVLKVITTSNFPLISSENVYNHNYKQNLSNSTISEILNYLNDLGYITINTDAIHVTYLGLSYESRLRNERIRMIFNSIIVPIIVSLITTLILNIESILQFLSQLMKK